jgi:hypothetical protein
MTETGMSIADDGRSVVDTTYIMKRLAEMHVSSLRAERCPPCSLMERIKRI